MPDDLDLSKYTKSKPVSPGPDLSKYKQPQPTSEDGFLKTYGAPIVRGISGFTPGGLIGAAAGGAGELLAQTLEGRPEYNWPQVGTQATINALPFGGALKGIGRAAIRGGALGAGGALATQQAEEGLHIPTEEEAKGIILGGALGAAGGAAGGKLQEIYQTPPKVKAGTEIIPEVKTPAAQAPEIKLPVEVQTQTKPKFRLTRDGDYVDLDTGEVVGTVKKSVKESVKESTVKPAVETVTDFEARLPRSLKGAKPRYTEDWTPQFESDIDKALYIIAQKTGSKSNFKYMNWLKEKTGLDEGALVKAGNDVKAKLGNLYDTGNRGAVPKLNTLEVAKKPKVERTMVLPYGGKLKVGDAPEVVKMPEAIKPQVEVPNDIPEVKIAAEQIPSNVTKPPESVNPLRTAIAESRQLQTAFDLSWPFRQGITNITRPEFWKSFSPSIKAALKEENFAALNDMISKGRHYDILKKSGVEFEELGEDIAKRPEALRGKILEKYLPGVRASNRAYTAFGNYVRYHAGARLAEDAEKAGIPLEEVVNEGGKLIKRANENSRAIAKYVNDTTGRGNLGRYEGSAPLLNDLFFSPKLISSRVNMFRRAFGGGIGKNVDPVVAKNLRKEAIRSMLGVGGLATGSIALSKLAGAKGTEDPISTDFGKLRVGKTRLDFTGGFQQYIRVAAQIAREKANIDGKTQNRNRLQTFGRFARNKLSPAAGAIADWMAGENVIGEEFTYAGAARDRLVPLIAQDLWEVFQEDRGKTLPAAAASTFGVGVQSY